MNFVKVSIVAAVLALDMVNLSAMEMRAAEIRPCCIIQKQTLLA